MGMAIAVYRIARDDVVGVQADLDRVGILTEVTSEAEHSVELRAMVAPEGVAYQPELDLLRRTVEGVLKSRGVPLDLTRQAFDGGVGVVFIDLPELEDREADE
jgi:hypothetical protein